MLFKRGLIKLPKNKKFEFQPRYYDPVKEELDERVSIIKERLRAEEEGEIIENGYSGRISQGFRDGRKQTNAFSGFTSNTAFVRVLIALILIGGGYIWLEHGEQLGKYIEVFSSFAFSSIGSFLLLGIVFLYVFARLKTFRHKRK